MGRAPEGEYRKKITAVFADLVGSTALAERLDAELFAELLRTFLERMASTVEAHGGSVEHLAGDGVLGVFGAERAHGDDALRAVRAAAAMLSELERLNEEVASALAEPLRMRVGVNTGTIVVGGRVAGRAISLGDPMNVAARLQAEAAPGEVLLGEETHRLVSRDVDSRPAGELELRGRGERLPAHRLIATEPAERAPGLPEASLVGRERELGLLTVAFERAQVRGASEFVTVLGEPGIGKSRLLGELADRYARSARVLAGRCLSYGEGITYWAIAEIVRQAAEIERLDPPALAREKLDRALAAEPDREPVVRQLAELLGVEQANGAGEGTEWAVRRLLETVAASGPLIVIIDDLHWGEPRLLDLVRGLASGLRGPVTLACMARYDLLDRAPEWERACPTTIRLRPLTEGDTEQLVEALAGPELPTPLRERLVELAAGNPLFVEQALQMLVDEGALVRDAGGWSATAAPERIAVPPSIEATLAARIDHLPGAERRCAECAAVIGTEFSAGSIDELVGEQAEPALERLRRKLLIEPVRRPGAGAGRLRFRHGLLRDAIYEAIPKARRAELHELVAERMRERLATRLGEVDELLGYHYEAAARYRAGLLGAARESDRLAARAIEHLTAAGRRAAGRQDDDRAAGFFGRVVALAGDSSPSRLEPLLELGTALVRGGDTEQAEQALVDAQRAARGAGDPRLDAEVRVLAVNLRRLTSPRWWAEHGRAEATELTRIFGELDDVHGAAKAWHLLGKAHSDRGEQAAAREAFEHALERAQRAEDPGTEAWVRYWLLQASVFGPAPCLDVIERAREDLRWARTHANRSLEGSVLTRMGEMLARAGRVPEAQDAFAEARGLFESLGRPSHLAYMAISTASVEPLASDPAGAERELRPAYEFFADVGAEHILATVAPMLAATLISRGELTEAVALTDRARALAARDDLDAQVKWRTARAGTLVAAGEATRAATLASEAVALAERTDTVILHADALASLAHALIAAGAAAEGREAATAAVARYERKGDVVSAARWRVAAESLAPG